MMSTPTLAFFCAIICCSWAERPSAVSSPNIIIMLMDDVSRFSLIQLLFITTSAEKSFLHRLTAVNECLHIAVKSPRALSSVLIVVPSFSVQPR